MTGLAILAAITVVIAGGLLIAHDKRRRGEFTPPRIHDNRREWLRFQQAIDKEKSTR